MTIKLYDLAGADSDRRFSPFCWRTKLALAHKGLDYETVPWRFIDKDAIAFSGSKKVPVIVDGDRAVSDSREIALWLDEAYSDRPALFESRAALAHADFIDAWSVPAMMLPILRAVALDIHDHLTPDDQAYFRETREKFLGSTLEALAGNADEAIETLRKNLEPLRATLARHDWLAGDAPGYVDYIIGANFLWARTISPKILLGDDDPLCAWRERLMQLHGGVVEASPGYPVAA